MTEPFIIRSLLKSHIKWLVSKGCKVYVMCSDGDDISWIESQGAKVFKICVEFKCSSPPNLLGAK